LEAIDAFSESALLLPAASKIPKLDHIPDGQIIVIRFIRSDRKLDIFTEKFEVSRNLVYTYVRAVIDTSAYSLALYLGDELIQIFDYNVPSTEWKI